MKRKDVLCHRLKVYNYSKNGYSWILIKISEVSRFVKNTPKGFFPRIFINSFGSVVGSYESGTNNKHNHDYITFKNIEIMGEL